MPPEMVDTLTDVEQGGRQQLSLYQAPKVYFWLLYAGNCYAEGRVFLFDTGTASYLGKLTKGKERGFVVF